MSSPQIKSVGPDRVAKSRITKGRIWFATSSALALILTAADGAAAQTAASDSQGVQLEEVVVTAQHRVESLQKAAVSVSSVPGAEIRDRQLNTIGDVLAQTPAVVIQNSTKGQAVYIRGIGSTGDSQDGGDPAINLNIDGVYQQQAVVALASTLDLDRIEVLRGPQGTLYGRNSNAGSVNVLTRDPTLGSVSGFGVVQVGNYSAVRAEAAINVPIGDTVAARLAVASNKHDGYYSNGGASADSYAARLKLLFAPTDALSIKLSGLYSKEKGNPTSTVPAPVNSADPYNTYYAQFGIYLPSGRQNTTFSQINGQIDYETPIGNLTVIPAYSHTHQLQDTALLPFGASAQDATEKAKSLEARLASKADSQIKWVAGLYYYKADVTHVYDPAYLIDFTHFERSIFPVNVGSGNGTRSLAAFGQVTVPVTDRLRVTGGARYTKDRKTFEWVTETALYVYTDGGVAKNDYKAATFKGGVEYDLAEDSMFYAQVSNGYKAGGFNTSDLTLYKPEKILAYEAGLKNRFWDNRVQLNLSAFHYDYDNYQERLNAPDATNANGFSQKIINAATLKTYGGEADLTVALTPHDRLHLAAAYLHSRGDVSYLGGSITTPIQYDFKNVTPPNSPTWSGTVGYAHTFELPNGAALVARGDMRWSSKYDTSVDDSEFDGQKSFTRSDISVTYTAPDEAWSLRAYLRNVENNVQTLFTLAPPIPGLAALELSDPQTYGLALMAKF